jgi:very-short-patch-repair endonuclease
MTQDLTPVRGEVRLAGFRRLSHGLYLPQAETSTDARELLRDLAAWRLVLPPDAVFTHVTAAALNGWWLPLLPEHVPVFAAYTGEAWLPRRSGLVCSRMRRTAEPAPPVLRRGLPCDAPEEVLLRAARDLAELDLIVLVTSAVRRGDVTGHALARICATRRPGVRRLRLAKAFADGRSESPGEVLLRVFHELADVPVQPQVDLHDDGRFLGRADLLIKGTNLVQEYDGAPHLERRQQVADRRRDRGLAGSPYVRRAYTGDDLTHHPLAVLQEIDRAIGRRHRPERLRRWRAWIARSTYSVEGRRRLQNRWLRVTELTDW